MWAMSWRFPRRSRSSPCGELAHRPCSDRCPGRHLGADLVRRRRQGASVYDRAAARFLPPPARTAGRLRVTAGCWPAIARPRPAPRRSPTTSPSHPRRPTSPNWFAWPVPDGRSRSVSRPRRTSAAWDSTRPPLRGLVPPHHTGHAGPHLPSRTDRPRPRKGGRRNGPTSLVPLTVAEVRQFPDLAHPPAARYRDPDTGSTGHTGADAIKPSPATTTTTARTPIGTGHEPPPP